MRGAIVSAFGAPPIDGLGTTGGFKLIVEDRGNLGLDELQRVSDQIVGRRQQDAGPAGPVQQLRREHALAVPGHRPRPSAWPWACRSATSSTRLQVYLGSYYVNNFNEFGRTWQVNVQADPKFRSQVADIRQLQVRNNQGQMIRLGTLLDVRDTSGPVMVMRYNMYSAAAITGNAGAGHQLGRRRSP